MERLVCEKWLYRNRIKLYCETINLYREGKEGEACGRTWPKESKEGGKKGSKKTMSRSGPCQKKEHVENYETARG